MLVNWAKNLFQPMKVGLRIHPRICLEGNNNPGIPLLVLALIVPIVCSFELGCLEDDVWHGDIQFIFCVFHCSKQVQRTEPLDVG